MKTYQFREMTTEDLKSSLKESYEALENLRFQHSTGQLENFKGLHNTKKDIAKIRTLLKERDLKINENLKKAIKE